MRLLVVEDAARMADLLRRGLEEEGYSVDVVMTGQDAVWMASEFPYDAIVLDVMCPTSTASKCAAGSGALDGGRPCSC